MDSGRLEILLELGLMYHYSQSDMDLHEVIKEYSPDEINEAADFVAGRGDLIHALDSFEALLSHSVGGYDV